jgi:hypothetical protein
MGKTTQENPMPDFVKSLHGRDLGHLQIVAEMWGVDLENLEARLALPRLGQSVLNRAAVQEIVDQLPGEARLALEDLQRSEGRLPWQLFTRRYGIVREMGAGRRDRLQPQRNPASPAEMLWYRALVGRAFFDTPSGPEEFAYIPDDLLPLLPSPQEAGKDALGRHATPGERAYLLPASDRLLDHTCTLLAALRLGLQPAEIALSAANWSLPVLTQVAPLTPAALQALCSSAGLLDASGLPLPEPTREFLEAPRAQALAKLVRAWLASSQLNELRLLPGLSAEGEWQNDPLLARQSMLDFLTTVPGAVPGSTSEGERPFWSLGAFVDAVRQEYPDFQRPAGDYDSWYLRDLLSGEFLRGFAHWERIEGGLIRYLVCGPLHWLGVLDLAASGPLADPTTQITAFRYSPWAASLLKGQPPESLPPEEAPLQVRSDARLIVPRLAPRALRYQLARFGVWEKETPDHYQYRLTPASLLRARQQGLTANHLLSLLRRHAPTIAPSLVKAIERWERSGLEARLGTLSVLRLSTPELLQQVRSSRMARFLGEPLGPTAVIVKPGAMDKVLAGLAEMGYLGEIENDV